MTLSSRSIAVQGVGFGPASMALQGFAAIVQAQSLDAVFDAPYQAYVKRVRSGRNDVRDSRVSRSDNDVAISRTEGYDSAVGGVAPRVGDNPSLSAVAPMLQKAEPGIFLHLPIQPFDTAAQRAEDEAAMFALFMLMADDD